MIFVSDEQRPVLQQDGPPMPLIDAVAGKCYMVMPVEFTTTVTKADGTTAQHTYPAGTPFLGVKWEPYAWELIKAGKLRGYSIGGSSERILVDLHE